MVLTMPGWKDGDPKPVCSSLWMTPPAQYWQLNLSIMKASLPMASCARPIFAPQVCLWLSIAINSVFFEPIPPTEAVTQFRRALEALGIDLICANSPQAKGRVERANQTFQDRLVKEMRLRGINDYQTANAYLPEFIRFYNRKFAVLPHSTGDDHLSLDPAIDLDFLFSIQDTRTISKDLIIQFDHVTYQIITDRPRKTLSNEMSWLLKMSRVLFLPISITRN